MSRGRLHRAVPAARPGAGAGAPEGVRGSAAAQGDLGRIVTVPNVLSLARIVLVGAYLDLLLWQDDRVVATVVLAVAGATDFADGYIARRYDQVTTVGKVLDPVADRILLAAAIISMIVYGAVPTWLAAPVISREALVAGTVLVLASLGAPRIDVSLTGKAATFGLMVCFPLLLLGHGPGGFARALHDVALVLVVPALVLSFAAALGYVPVARRAMAVRRGAGAPLP